jgi:hypothetical protein
MYLGKYSVWINYCCFYNLPFLCRTLKDNKMPNSIEQSPSWEGNSH